MLILVLFLALPNSEVLALDRCSQTRLPPRAKEAQGGSRVFAELVKSEPNPTAADHGNYREEVLFDEIVEKGNVPDFFRSPIAVSFSCEQEKIEISVFPDYLAVGSNEDYVHIPLRNRTAQLIADRLGYVLPTEAMVEKIRDFAKENGRILAGVGLREPRRFRGKPNFCRGDSGMISTRCFQQVARAFWDNPDRPRDEKVTLVTSHKKDVVVSERLEQGNVAIYGWQTTRYPTQPLYTGHRDTYVDYSHGIRFILPTIKVNGEVMLMEEAISEGKASCIFGGVKQLRAALRPFTSEDGPLYLYARAPCGEL